MAFGTGPDGAVGVGLADGVAALAAHLPRRFALQLGELVGRPLDRAFVEFLGELDLLFRKVLGAVDGRPGGGRVAAPQELLVLRGVALTAVFGR